MLDTSPEALAVVAHVQGARLALMNENYAAARDHVRKAIDALSVEEDGFADKMLPDTGIVSGKPRYLPYSVDLVATNDVGVTHENELALQKAYGAPETADSGDTLTLSHLEDLDVAVSAALLPADESMAHLVETKKFLDAGQYAEACRALVALERGIIFRTQALDAIPAQGDIE